MSNPCAFSMPSNAVSVTANFNSPRDQYRVDDCCWCGWDDDSFAWYVSALCWGSYLGFVFDYEFRVYFCWLDC